MNYTAEICSALLHRKLTLITAVCDAVGMTERQGLVLIGRLCGDGTLRRERDYIYIKNEAKVKLLAESAQAAGIQASAAAKVAERMAANEKTSTPPAVKKARASTKPSDIPLPSTITVEQGVPIPPKRWGKVAAPNPFRQQFTSMAIGASFAIPVPDGFEPREVAELLRKSASNFRRVMPHLRVTIRTEEGEKTVRLWRDPDEPGEKTPAPTAAAKASNGIRLPKDKRSGATARA